MAQSLARALEGISFPCDRAQLIEYARTNKASSRALSALEAVPARNFNSMTEILAAVPSKTEMRRRPLSAEPPLKRQPEEKRQEEMPLEAPLEEQVAAQREAVAPSFPLTIQPPDFTDQSAWLRLGAEWSASYLRAWRRLWSAWLQ